MKLSSSIKLVTAFACGILLASFAHANEGQSKDKSVHTSEGAVLKADAAGVSGEWLAKAKAAYPLDSCVVSEDKFDGGDMGKPQDYVYKQAGKPDRLVRFCCNDCIKDFKKDPAKYVHAIDEAANAKAKSAPSK